MNFIYNVVCIVCTRVLEIVNKYNITYKLSHP